MGAAWGPAEAASEEDSPSLPQVLDWDEVEEAYARSARGLVNLYESVSVPSEEGKEVLDLSFRVGPGVEEGTLP